MNVNRRTATLLIVVVIVIGGVYAITWWQRSRETRRLLADLMVDDHGVATKAMMGLRQRAPSIRGQLIGFVRRGNRHVKWRAASLLSEVRDRETREALTEALTDAVPEVRLQAALSLAKLGVRGAADRIALMAQNEDEPVFVRAGMVRALMLLRSETHLAEVAALAEDRPPPPPPEEEEPGETEEAEDPEEAEEAEEYVDELAPLRIEAVRATAVLAAASEAGASGTGDEAPAMRAVEVLSQSSTVDEEPNDEVRQAACYALGDLAKLVSDDEVHSRVIEALLAALDDEVGDVRIAALHSLRILRPPVELRQAVHRALEEARNDDHYWMRYAAEEVTGGG